MCHSSWYCCVKGLLSSHFSLVCGGVVVYISYINVSNYKSETVKIVNCKQTAGLSHTMKVDNSAIERVEEFEYLGTRVTNQNSIQKEIKSTLKLGNAYYHSV